jgi:DNA-binding transcriptional MocR family regulator
MTSAFRSMLWNLKQGRRITASAHAVLHQLAGFTGPRGTFPSHETIAARAGCSTRTVIRALEAAYALGIVERTKRMMKKGARLVRCSNDYTLRLIDTAAAKLAAKGFARQLREALERRKQRLRDLTDIPSAEPMLPLISKGPMHSKDEWLAILTALEAGLTPREAGYRGSPR